MILLTDEQIEEVLVVAQKHKWEHGAHPRFEVEKELLEAQVKKTLISVGKESRRMDGTIYLVPDYVEYRKALKEVGLE